MRMKSLSLTSLLLPCALGRALTGAGPAFAQKTHELKVSHYLPPNHTIHKELVRWSEELAKKSNGQLKLTLFPAGQMGPIIRQYDLTRTGVADVSFFLHGALPGRFPLTEMASIPFIFNADSPKPPGKALSGAQASAVMTAMAPRFAAEHPGTRILYLIAAPTVSLFFREATIRKPADMKGLRLRHNGPLPAKMIEAWGATAAAVAPAEISDALAKGTIDGMTFNYEGAQSFQFAPSVKTVTELNAYAASFGLVMNAKKYDSLPEALRRLIDETTGVEAARRVGGLYDVAEAIGRKYFQDNKVTLNVPTDEEKQVFAAAVEPLIGSTIKALEAKGQPAHKLYDEFRQRVNSESKNAVK